MTTKRPTPDAEKLLKRMPHLNNRIDWTCDDLLRFLDSSGVPRTDNNLNTLCQAIDPNKLEMKMQEAAWNYIEMQINKLISGAKFEEEVQCWDVGFITTDGTPDVTELCTAINLTDAEAFAELGRIIDQLRDELKLGEVLSLAKTHTETLPF